MRVAASPTSVVGPASTPDDIGAAARALLGRREPIVLAISGGIDSMVLLDAVVRSMEPGDAGRLLVATFDHGSGGHATDAVEHVRRVAAACGLPTATQRAANSLRGEAAWREARWRFLRSVANARDARVATAHTQDDHIETIVMRALRGAGARGLSALLAPSPVLRPFLSVSRATVEAYARANGVAWIDDPTNRDRAFLRNRVRMDLLPAMRAQAPAIDEELLALARRAADLRRSCVAIARPLVVEAGPGRVVARGVTGATWPAAARALLWQTLAEAGGIALDWRGTERLARFSSDGRPGLRIPLSGGFEAVHRGDSIELRRRPAVATDPVALHHDRTTIFGMWRFRPVAVANLQESESADPHLAWFPPGVALEVRPWRDGDRMSAAGNPPRRVKRFLADRRVAAADRAGWPVVVADGEIVWIPGVRRGSAATVRSGRPRVCFACERLND